MGGILVPQVWTTRLEVGEKADIYKSSALQHKQIRRKRGASSESDGEIQTGPVVQNEANTEALMSESRMLFGEASHPIVIPHSRVPCGRDGIAVPVATIV